MTTMFDERQNDALLESINISFGLAASLIGDMLESYVHLRVPSIHTIPIYKLHETILSHMGETTAFYATKQRFFGSFGGEVIFAFSEESAKEFTTLLLHESPNSNEDTQAALLELTNILTASCIGQLSQMLEGESLFAVPDIQKISCIGSSTFHEALEYDNAIVISTALDVAEKNIQGHMFILLSNSMLEKLTLMLQKMFS
ncbi:MAG: chemotaxis protein CheX [Campylobacterales bacterium]|nr:chemotaxis protein CheX [Campylobacterales bacterium]